MTLFISFNVDAQQSPNEKYEPGGITRMFFEAFKEGQKPIGKRKPPEQLGAELADYEVNNIHSHKNNLMIEQNCVSLEKKQADKTAKMKFKITYTTNSSKDYIDTVIVSKESEALWRSLCKLKQDRKTYKSIQTIKSVIKQ
ncbi:MAG: hypothetical protein QM500_02000 [Methylococcales bacterium]